jgi:hypothetical protein
LTVSPFVQELKHRPPKLRYREAVPGPIPWKLYKRGEKTGNGS